MRHHIVEKTLDDVMRQVFSTVKSHDQPNSPTKGDNSELMGVLIEVTNPRARISRTESRGKPFSCLGELCWYLGKTNELAPISYYIRDYEKYAEGNVIYGGYGPRLFNFRSSLNCGGVDQVQNIINLLKINPDSRRAVIQLFDAVDIERAHKDIPCTTTLQFMIRRNELHLFACMRSNDAFMGLPHDIFCFTMLQELLARALSTWLLLPM